MKKLVLSAFALSLFLISPSGHSQVEGEDDFLGLETEILPDLQGEQQFTPRDLHQKKEWNVEEKQVEIDMEKPLKGQSYSLIPWDTQDPESWLSIDKWLIERSLKDKTPDWKIRLRDDRHQELAGKVLQCRGTCEVYRGTMKARVQHLSRVLEGDEFKTNEDSSAWIFLMDGTLVRIGPLSSVSFQEINWSKKSVLHLVRLNQGHIYWHARKVQDEPLELSPETDAISLPLMVREANQEFFERELFGLQSDRQKLDEVLKLEENAISSQIKKTNELKARNNKLPLVDSKVMLVAPNGTLISRMASFDMLHYPGGKTFFKKRSSQTGEEFSLHLRGYSDHQTFPVTENEWFEVASNGRDQSKVSEVSGDLQITELITKRIKSLELAREIWIDKYSEPLLKDLDDSKKLALNHGYTLWGDELSKRYDFLVEFTRRIETTNLRSMENLLKKLEARGEVLEKKISDNHYRAALNRYLMGLKVRYTDRKMQIREMNDLQYYVWILKSGKL